MAALCARLAMKSLSLSIATFLLFGALIALNEYVSAFIIPVQYRHFSLPFSVLCSSILVTFYFYGVNESRTYVDLIFLVGITFGALVLATVSTPVVNVVSNHEFIYYTAIAFCLYGVVRTFFWCKKHITSSSKGPLLRSGPL